MKKISYLVGSISAALMLIPAMAAAKTLSGTVSAIDSGTAISVTGANTTTVYTVDLTNAKLLRHYGASMAFTDIQVKDKVAISGTVSGDAIAATTLRDNSLQGVNGNFTGTISAINGTSFTLLTPKRATQTINTDATTKVKLNSAAAQFSNLSVGQSVKVSGVWNRTNSNVEANTVTIVLTSKTYTGVITAISSGTAITMNGTGANSTTSYTVDLTKSKVIRHYGAKTAVTDLQVNDKVTVVGTLLNGTITATSLRDDSLQAVDGTFVGSVTAINGTSFSLLTSKRATQTVMTNASTTFKMGGVAAMFSSISVGATTTVKGVWDVANSNVLAHSVTIKAPAMAAPLAPATTTVSQ